MGTGRSGGGSIKGNIGKRVNSPYAGDKDPTSDEFKKTYLLNANPKRDAWMSATTGAEIKRLRDEYLKNCQRVAYVTDLRLAGYDVEAVRRGYGDIDANFYGEKSANSFYKIYDGAKWENLTAATTQGMYDQMLKLLPNAGDRAIIAVRWTSGGAHATNIVNHGGKLYMVDGQVNETTLFSRELKDIKLDGVRVLPTGNGMIRTHKTVNQNLAKYVLKRRKNQ